MQNISCGLWGLVLTASSPASFSQTCPWPPHFPLPGLFIPSLNIRSSLLPQDRTQPFSPLCLSEFLPPILISAQKLPPPRQLSRPLPNATYSLPLLSSRPFKNKLINMHYYTCLRSLSSPSLPGKLCEARDNISFSPTVRIISDALSRFSTNLCWRKCAHLLIQLPNV